MVMPLYDDNPFRLPHRPVVTWSLIARELRCLPRRVGTPTHRRASIAAFRPDAGGAASATAVVLGGAAAGR